MRHLGLIAVLLLTSLPWSMAHAATVSFDCEVVNGTPTKDVGPCDFSDDSVSVSVSLSSN